MKKYVVTPTADERAELTGLLSAGRTAAQKVAHARILLQADAADGGPGWTDDRIAEAVEVSTDTVGRVRQRFVESGVAAALTRKAQDKPSREPVRDGAAEARLITLACSPPPGERTRWVLRMLADKRVELEVVPAVSADRVGSSWPGWRT